MHIPLLSSNDPLILACVPVLLPTSASAPGAVSMHTSEQHSQLHPSQVPSLRIMPKQKHIYRPAS